MDNSPHAWVVDIDGTLALRGHRSPYDWRSVLSDLPNLPVITAVRALANYEQVDAIIMVSGREERARALTQDWLESQRIPFDELFMRRNGDYRPDEVVKEEIFLSQIEPRFSVQGVIEDRRRVVAMWRRLGLVCFQVDEGDF